MPFKCQNYIPGRLSGSYMPFRHKPSLFLWQVTKQSAKAPVLLVRSGVVGFELTCHVTFLQEFVYVEICIGLMNLHWSNECNLCWLLYFSLKSYKTLFKIGSLIFEQCIFLPGHTLPQHYARGGGGGKNRGPGFNCRKQKTKKKLSWRTEIHTC